MNKKKLKFAIFIIAYNAFDTIIEVFERIPDSMKQDAEEIYVIDDCSQDATYNKIVSYKQKKGLKKLTIFRNSKNLGYGGNQKKGYKHAIEKAYDLVVMLHADAQYAPEKINKLLKPFDFLQGDIGMVFGSRMLEDPLKGGMPFYKFIANKSLTAVQNTFLGTQFSEFHSGYRCYSCKALSRIPYHLCSDGFSFDSEVMIMLLQHGFKIKEVPIPTYYGKEKCHVPLVSYGLNCLRAVIEYKLNQLGIAYFERYSPVSYIRKINNYKLKNAPYSSHTTINALVDKSFSISKKRLITILDVGCGNGTIFKEIANKAVIDGIDISTNNNIPHYRNVYNSSIDNFDQINTLPLDKYDVIVFADILEHCLKPDDILVFYQQFLKKGGSIIISVPNIANIFIRLSLLFGIFNYTEKGILDRTHIKFFTKNTIFALIKQVGLVIKEYRFSIIPIELIIPGIVYLKKESFIRKLIYAITSLRSTLFAYQFIIVAKKIDI